MGVVYRARHERLNRTVALKVLRAEFADDDAFRERFMRESQSLAALHHPNIVTVYDAGEDQGRLYIAMQYIDGPDLARVLHREGPLPPARAMWIIDQLADALEAAHARGLIHRDVKPGNVLLDNERCYLSDFGLTKSASVVTAVTAPGQFIGTVHYSPPEQIRGKQLDARADVYALGGVLYRMLAGEVTYPRDDDMAVIHGQLYDEPPRLTDARPELPPALDAVIFRALAKDRDERFASCTELAAAANHAMARKARVADDRPTAAILPEGATRVADPTTRDTARMGIARWRPRLPSGGVTAALIALGGLAAAALIVFSGHAKNGPITHTTSRVATTLLSPVPDLTLAAPVKVGYQPTGLAVGIGGVYAANEGDGTLRRVDALAGKLDSQKVTNLGGPDAVAVGADSIWVTSRKTNMLTRIDPRTLTIAEQIPVGHGPNAVAVGTGDYAVWVANEQDGTVMRIDANTNTQVPAGGIKVGRRPRAVATSPGYVFVANRGGNTVTRIGAKSRRANGTIQVGKRPTAMIVANKLLWVANAGDGTVARVNMKTDQIVGRTHVGGQPFTLAATSREVFVGDRSGGKVLRLNAKTGAVEGKPVAVPDPVAMRAGGGSIWVASRSKGTVTRIELF